VRSHDGDGILQAQALSTAVQCVEADAAPLVKVHDVEGPRGEPAVDRPRRSHVNAALELRPGRCGQRHERDVPGLVLAHPVTDALLLAVRAERVEHRHVVPGVGEKPRERVVR